MTHGTAARHAEFVAAFAEQILGMKDPAAPTPVPEWRAKDIVEHLLDWPVPLLAAWADVQLHDDQSASLIDRWGTRGRELNRILTDDETARQPVSQGPMAGQPLGQVIDRIYSADIFMHTWDLARANGQTPNMNADYADELLEGMRPIESILRDSGQYGPAHPTTSNDPIDKLMAFIGRDPEWTPTGEGTAARISDI